MSDLPVGARRVLWHDPNTDGVNPSVELYLTYEGLLLGANGSNSRAAHKHEIRRVFHKQLKRLWEVHPILRDLRLDMTTESADGVIRLAEPKPAIPIFANEFTRCGYQFVPLVIADLMALCRLEILFLRPDLPGGVLKSGDIDNRLKTLFDALRLPNSTSELGGYGKPEPVEEEPFFCLLEDDQLIDSVAVTTGLMLEPVLNLPLDGNHARIVIKAQTHATHFLVNNLHLR